MKIFGWIRDKYDGKDGAPKAANTRDSMRYDNIVLRRRPEEFSDWPNGLLAIGTFGNTNLEQSLVDSGVSSEEEKGGEESKSEPSERAGEGGGVAEKGVKREMKPSKKRANGVSKKSLSFLLKKVRSCGGPIMAKDPTILDPKMAKSRMGKILMVMLHKKIYPQRPSRKPTSRKCLDTPEAESDEDEDEEKDMSPKSKWVKTDSEYIVLEI